MTMGLRLRVIFACVLGYARAQHIPQGDASGDAIASAAAAASRSAARPTNSSCAPPSSPRPTPPASHRAACAARLARPSAPPPRRAPCRAPLASPRVPPRSARARRPACAAAAASALTSALEASRLNATSSITRASCRSSAKLAAEHEHARQLVGLGHRRGHLARLDRHVEHRCLAEHQLLVPPRVRRVHRRVALHHRDARLGRPARQPLAEPHSRSLREVGVARGSAAVAHPQLEPALAAALALSHHEEVLACSAARVAAPAAPRYPAPRRPPTQWAATAAPAVVASPPARLGPRGLSSICRPSWRRRLCWTTSCAGNAVRKGSPKIHVEVPARFRPATDRPARLADTPDAAA